MKAANARSKEVKKKWRGKRIVVCGEIKEVTFIN